MSPRWVLHGRVSGLHDSERRGNAPIAPLNGVETGHCTSPVSFRKLKCHSHGVSGVDTILSCCTIHALEIAFEDDQAALLHMSVQFRCELLHVPVRVRRRPEVRLLVGMNDPRISPTHSST